MIEPGSSMPACPLFLWHPVVSAPPELAGAPHRNRRSSISRSSRAIPCSLQAAVNMRGFPMDTFSERVSYMVNRVAAASEARTVACITLYPYFEDFGVEGRDEQGGGTSEEYRQALRDVVAACPCRNVHLIEGTEILTDISGLTTDLIHPGDNGMIEMGRNLAQKLQPLLSATGPAG